MIEPKGSVGRAQAAPVTDAQARKTAAVVAAVLLAIAAWNLYRGRPTVVAVLGGAALLLLLAGFFVPAAARRFHVFWMKFAVVLGHINSRVLLGLMYYGVFTIYGVVSRLVGRDPLRRRGAGAESYWVERKTTRQAREQFERLF
ncbi:MAG TPA: SxtJ family membrane protein [Pyrinomonadaceae bacterium]|nr:SxtJ family membrane protein [Pyrinomonadaceae bacterium]